VLKSSYTLVPGGYKSQRQSLRSSSGSFAMLAAIRLASSLRDRSTQIVMAFAALYDRIR